MRTMENYKWCTISFVLFTFLLVHHDTCVCVMLFCLLFVSVSSVIFSFRSTINVKLCQSDIIRLKQFKELSWQKAKLAFFKVNKNNSGNNNKTNARSLAYSLLRSMCVCVSVTSSRLSLCHENTIHDTRLSEKGLFFIVLVFMVGVKVKRAANRP